MTDANHPTPRSLRELMRTPEPPSDVKKVFDDYRTCDVILRLLPTGRQVFAHKNVLETSSEYFAAMFGSAFAESSKSYIEIEVPASEHAMLIGLASMYPSTAATPAKKGKKKAVLDSDRDNRQFDCKDDLDFEKISYMLQCLLQQAKEGKRAGGTFKDEAWNVVRDSCKAKFKANSIVTPMDKKKRRMYQKIADQGLEHFQLMSQVFSGTTAVGSLAKGTGQDVMDDSDDSELFEDDVSNEIKNEIDKEIADESSQERAQAADESTSVAEPPTEPTKQHLPSKKIYKQKWVGGGGWGKAETIAQSRRRENSLLRIGRSCTRG
ncbi:hypothetical protein DFJ73DRAFT_767660 [Zopfochytrium polystomum]|nr:hypothetical protein DFJ73DRAFT_767660 [Zopfochytrium polystomum]